LELAERLAEARRQEAYFHVFVGLPGAMAHQRRTPLHQAGEQARRLLVVALEQHLVTVDLDLANADVAVLRAPGRGGHQQRGGAIAQPALATDQLEGRLLAGAAHELAHATKGLDRLDQPAFELITRGAP